MRAAVMEEYREPLEIKEVENPQTDSNGIVAKVDSCGVCRSDWHAWNKDWYWLGFLPETPQILGHEPCGTVIETGEDVENVSEGDHIAIPFNFACGNCDLCRNGRENLCRNALYPGFMEEVPGAFAEEIYIPNADINAVPLSNNIDPETSAGLGCRYMTSYHALAHQADVSGGEWVVIYGLGGIGLSAVHIANALGANVVGVSRTEEKLKKGEKLGAIDTVNAREVEDPVKKVKDITNGGADVSLDSVAKQETLQNSIMSLDKGGRHVQVGYTSKENEGKLSIPSDLFVATELEFYGSLGLQPSRYPELLNMIDNGKLDPTKLVNEKIALDQVSDTLKEMDDYKTIGIPVINKFN